MIFTGCDSKKTDKVEVTFWEEDDTTSVDKAWDEIIKDFESKNENIRVIRIHLEPESLRQNYKNSIIAGRGPCIISVPDDHIGTF